MKYHIHQGVTESKLIGLLIGVALFLAGLFLGLNIGLKFAETQLMSLMQPFDETVSAQAEGPEMTLPVFGYPDEGREWGMKVLKPQPQPAKGMTHRLQVEDLQGGEDNTANKLQPAYNARLQ